MKLAGLAIGLLCSSLAFGEGYYSGIPPESWTMLCLAGFNTEDTERTCAVVRPRMMDDVRAATRKWRERNASALREIDKACEARLMKAYKNDRNAIAQAKARFSELRAESWQQLSATPPAELEGKVNCRAYVEDFSAGNEKIDIRPDLVREIWDAPAAPATFPR